MRIVMQILQMWSYTKHAKNTHFTMTLKRNKREKAGCLIAVMLVLTIIFFVLACVQNNYYFALAAIVSFAMIFAINNSVERSDK
ncbi:MAG: hypothetical protein A2W93_14175 [Bacteroidetes bacterium GWF2_43_63]|nr:MAG: hypothetical protein A2W94_00745 [Bacteroidetes bacterium GWE2_42_42]OFY52488.1 MAG: hypothetical protein A2W93_14175 [Bacteroidetes bacterium GWF2_43_63]HBG71394.1 hypothetical protein [Bacteroidales bacterium]HCB60854.1 hypothetical protein [Bacteroidales bacterium]HCY23421.1 hypothetical protein [Bacteroidales bacterium]